MKHYDAEHHLAKRFNFSSASTPLHFQVSVVLNNIYEYLPQEALHDDLDFMNIICKFSNVKL